MMIIDKNPLDITFVETAEFIKKGIDAVYEVLDKNDADEILKLLNIEKEL